MLVVTMRFRLAKRPKVTRTDLSALRTVDGAEMAAAAYAAEKAKPKGGVIVANANTNSVWSLNSMRRAGTLSLEELGLRVTGPAEDMKAPESDQEDAGSSLKRMDSRSKDEGGLEDEQDAGEAATYGVVAVAERFER